MAAARTAARTAAFGQEGEKGRGGDDFSENVRIFVDMLIDTHTHFYDEWLRPDAEEAIQRALAAGVGKMIQADIDSRERPAMWEIGDRHPGVIFEMLGLYPGSVDDAWREEIDRLLAWREAILARETTPTQEAVGGSGTRQTADPASQFAAPARQNAVLTRGAILAREAVGGSGTRQTAIPASQIADPASQTAAPAPRSCIVAVGEIGLDYHEGKEFAAQQREAFRVQLELASAWDLPVNIHLRDAWEDFFAVIEDCRHLHIRGNLHCFSGSYELFERAQRSGEWSVGIGGVVTFRNASLAGTVARIPMERILLETDAPYLAPVPYRGKRNESAYLPLVAAKVAEIKHLPVEEVERITTHNAETLFRI